MVQIALCQGPISCSGDWHELILALSWPQPAAARGGTEDNGAALIPSHSHNAQHSLYLAKAIFSQIKDCPVDLKA